MMMDLLQRGFNQQPANQPLDPAAATALLCFYAVIIVVSLVVSILFLLTLSKCLKQISPHNRKMEPGQVWLTLIPCFGFVWLILMILKIAESLDNEYEERGLRGDGDYGKTMGIIYFVSIFIPCVNFISIVFLIIYWVKISGYTKELLANGRPGKRRRRDEDDDEDDEDDDRPSRRGGKGDDDDDAPPRRLR